MTFRCQATHGITYETIELYMQTAIDRLSLIKRQLATQLADFASDQRQTGAPGENATDNSSDYRMSNVIFNNFANCKGCLKRLVRLIESIPLKLQSKVNDVLEQLSQISHNDAYANNSSHLNKDDLYL